MDEKQKTSIEIDPDIWKKVKKKAIDKNMTTGQLVEQLLKEEIESED